MASAPSGGSSYTGAEPFLVGLSPQYWTHTPLCIGDLCNLGLVDGVDCYIAKSLENEASTKEPQSKRRKLSNRSSNDVEASHAKIIPLSKCHIEGIVVNVQFKSNGSVLYLLDDGTGMVDCIDWIDDDMYSLPPLVQPNPMDQSKTKFQVGDVVRVMGKIRCVSVGNVRETVVVRGKSMQVRDCIREVQVNLMEHLTMNGLRTKNISLDLASKHWLDCIMFRKRAGLTGQEDTIFDTACNPNSVPLEHRCGATQSSNYKPIRNGAEVLDLLGPTVMKSVSEHSDFPGSDDDIGAWRLFGLGCQCDLSYKDSLLYCHCQASTEALDPHFTFRDALLATLLQMERSIQSQDMSEPLQLHFQYNAILQDTQLHSVAQRIASKTENPPSNTRRLYISTFRALRKDGILHLKDRDTDTYLLVSREGVLEPYLRMVSTKDSAAVLERRLLREERPAYLANVPGARLQYIKKSLKQQDS